MIVDFTLSPLVGLDLGRLAIHPEPVSPIDVEVLVRSLNGAGLRWSDVAALSPIVASVAAWSVTLTDGSRLRRSAGSGRWSRARR